MRSKSDTVTGWIRGKKGESTQKPKMSPLVPGKPRLGNTDHPQLNRLTSQPQAVGALVGRGGGGVPEHLQPGGLLLIRNLPVGLEPQPLPLNRTGRCQGIPIRRSHQAREAASPLLGSRETISIYFAASCYVT